METAGTPLYAQLVGEFATRPAARARSSRPAERDRSDRPRSATPPKAKQGH